jgi:hypothetical protein
MLVLRINHHAEVVSSMTRQRKKGLKPFLHSRKAIALPVTFLMLFVSLIVLITATYYFSITRISSKTLALKTAGVEQEMLSFEKAIKFVSWSPGAYEIYEFGDFGGEFKAVPSGRQLILNLTDDSSFYDIFFNSSVGKAFYELSSSDELADGFFLKGDSRAIVNQSSSTTTQLYISRDTEGCEIALSYRPLASSTITDSSGTKPVNGLTLYIVSLNTSENITRLGSFRLKVGCSNVASSLRTYNFTSQMDSILIRSDLDGVINTVSLPISSNAQGAIVNLETIVCNVKIEDVGW